MIYIFDGSYTGFLCCIFEAFEMKEWTAIPVPEKQHQPNMFVAERSIFSDVHKAERIQNALKDKFGVRVQSDVYRAFLSEDLEAFKAVFYIVITLFKGQTNILENYGDSKVLYYHQTLKKVSRERHRMKAFIRFSKTNDGLFYAIIEPDFNVLPLILKFFKDRYADQKWMIYDAKRKYGFYYDTFQISEITLDASEQKELNNTALSIALDERDELFQNLWKRYFKSTNIEARKNIKLHLQHVPKRYWKYLVEKQ